MIDGLKPYPAMKDSGVVWLGEIPEHWELKRLGALLRERGETNEKGHVTEVLSVMRERGVIPYAEKGNVGNKKSEDITRYKVVRPNDIVVNCMNVIIGSVGLSRYTGCLSPVYYVLTRRAERDDPRYLNAYFQTKPFQESLVRIGNGILAHRMRIPMELLKCELFPRPPAAEQATIVRFLDYADRRIRRYILAKQKLIKLLEEQKQAIIHRAVTRGLDPNVRLKPSGTPWLGQIPAHWEVLPVKRCSIVISKGTTPSTEGQEILEEGPIRFIKAENVSGDVIVDRPRAFIDQETHNILRRSQLHEHDVLFVIAGATLGKIAIVRGSHLPANTNQAVAFIRPNRRVTPEFLAIWLQSNRIKEQIWLNAVQSAQPNLSMGSLGNFPVPLPPITEQTIIVDRLGAELRLSNAATAHDEREIELLREYRTRLVADVVTGKLDVREAAAKLSEQINEPEILGEPDTLHEGDEDSVDNDVDAAPEEAET